MKNKSKNARLGVAILTMAAMLGSCSSGSDSGSGVTVDVTGEWSLVTTSSQQFDATGGVCLSGAGTMTVSNQRITGSFAGSGAINEITGTVDTNGTVVGQFMRGGETIGNVLGSFSNLSGSGTWADIFGCSGDWTATQ